MNTFPVRVLTAIAGWVPRSRRSCRSTGEGVADVGKDSEPVTLGLGSEGQLVCFRQRRGDAMLWRKKVHVAGRGETCD